MTKDGNKKTKKKCVELKVINEFMRHCMLHAPRITATLADAATINSSKKFDDLQRCFLLNCNF